MKEIILSIQPKWIAKILNGEKTIEIRKTMPKCELPCKVYIYCTYGKGLVEFNHDIMPNFLVDFKVTKTNNNYRNFVNGKVVAEFTLNKIEEQVVFADKFFSPSIGIKSMLNYHIEDKACVSEKELIDYIGRDKFNGDYYNKFYAWHINDLKIYNEPKELGEFGIIKAPQSWCYIKEVQDV